MANLPIKDGAGASVFRKARGTGTDPDPYISEMDIAAIGQQADSEASSNTGTFGLISLFKRLLNTTLSVGATTLLKAVDAVGGGTDAGVAALALRRDSLATLTPADGDYTRLLVNARGALHVSQESQALLDVNGTTSSSGDNTIISAPGGGLRLVISTLIIQNESSTATTYIWKDGSTNRGRIRAQNQGDGVALVFPAGRGLRLTANTAFVLNLSGANATGYTIYYFTEAA